ncbi:hypothetical protein [Oryza sativa Japonica Group]|uniref:Uncharacterized protein n=1 Tax=Oryza sativa subsp. japonica TaxID=39947 RepID=Q5VNZ0_ORYSJ|nr:hypothetical protein [Oryza sativa Japonica Group]BAD68831.1 hypothetical protein [Oryza sativa Japonica Group]
MELAFIESWRKFVARIREKGYSLKILVQKKTYIFGIIETSHTEVEQTPIEDVQEDNVCNSEDDEPDSPLVVDAAEENKPPVEDIEMENNE